MKADCYTRSLSGFLAALLLVFLAPLALAADPFQVELFATEGRTVSAEIADLNGDGRGDLMQIVFIGFPPEERRNLRVFLQRSDGSFEPTPSFERPLPAGSAAYDLAELDSEPGVELLLLRSRGILALSLTGPDPVVREFLVPDGQTIGAVEDERGVDRLRLAWPELGSPPWLIVPQLSSVTVLSPDGEVMGQPRVGARANYFVTPRPGPLLVESDIQLFLDVPKLSVGDVDGDGRSDLVASSRHELRVFLRGDDGRFRTLADHSLPLARVSALDHVRGNGTVRVAASDLNGDGRLDMLISHLSGSVLDAAFRTSVHLNREGEWNLEEPDQMFETKGWGTDELVDLDGDGRPELVRVRLSLSVLEIVEALVTRSLDARIEIYQAGLESGFADKPAMKRKLDLALDFASGRARGFVPNVRADLNGDGYRDLLSSGSGKRVEVFLGGARDPYKHRAARQSFSTNGRIRFGDLEGDGMADFVLYDQRDQDGSLRLVRNLGVLPGSVPRISARQRTSTQ